MKGRNEFNLNKATVIVALQHYFDTVLFAEGHAPRVTDVAGTGVHAAGFAVTVEQPEKPE